MSKKYTPKPVTREEKILSGEDLQPKTRFEYFLKEASKQTSGGSSESSELPECTISDVGKVLSVSKYSGNNTNVVIVPRQTVEIVSGRDPVSAFLSNVNYPNNTTLENFVMTVNGTEYETEPIINGFSGGLSFYATDSVSNTTYSIAFEDNHWAFFPFRGIGNIPYGTYTVSLSAVIPGVTPKWVDDGIMVIAPITEDDMMVDFPNDYESFEYDNDFGAVKARVIATGGPADFSIYASCYKIIKNSNDPYIMVLEFDLGISDVYYLTGKRRILVNEDPIIRYDQTLTCSPCDDEQGGTIEKLTIDKSFDLRFTIGDSYNILIIPEGVGFTTYFARTMV